MTPAAVAKVHAYYCAEMRRYASVVFRECAVFLMALHDEDKIRRVSCLIGTKEDAQIAAELRGKLRSVTGVNGYVFSQVTWMGVGNRKPRSSDSRVLALVVVTSFPGVRKMATVCHYSERGGPGDVMFELDDADLKRGDAMSGLMLDLL